MAIARTGVYVDDYLECKINNFLSLFDKILSNFDKNPNFKNLFDFRVLILQFYNSISCRCKHFPCRATKTTKHSSRARREISM